MSKFIELDKRRQGIETLKQKVWRLASQRFPNDPTMEALLLSQINALETATKSTEQPLFSPTRIGALGISSDPSAVRLDETQAGDAPPSYEDNVSYQRLIAVAQLYFLANMEKAGLFRGVAKLTELFNSGQVRLSDGDGAQLLYQIDRTRFARYSSRDRMQAYSRVFGISKVKPPAGARPNTAFRRHFLTFNQSVAKFFRDKRVSDVIRPGNQGGSFGSIATVRRAGLDLRNNLKAASYGYVNVLRQEVFQLQASCVDILSASDVQQLFGTKDVWETLEQILRQYLNEEVRVSERLRLAEAGENILMWLAAAHVTERDRTALRSASATSARMPRNG